MRVGWDGEGLVRVRQGWQGFMRVGGSRQQVPQHSRIYFYVTGHMKCNISRFAEKRGQGRKKLAGERRAFGPPQLSPLPFNKHATLRTQHLSFSDEAH